jgi:hypothetical protein
VPCFSTAASCATNGLDCQEDSHPKEDCIRPDLATSFQDREDSSWILSSHRGFSRQFPFSKNSADACRPFDQSTTLRWAEWDQISVPVWSKF